ncbi:MAG: hypothetical protein PHX00_07370, partial [Synergistaceae bacterium]|nr:hypothetical protein [Synergistaceae bacterium]
PRARVVAVADENTYPDDVAAHENASSGRNSGRTASLLISVLITINLPRRFATPSISKRECVLRRTQQEQWNLPEESRGRGETLVKRSRGLFVEKPAELVCPQKVFLRNRESFLRLSGKNLPCANLEYEL